MPLVLRFYHRFAGPLSGLEIAAKQIFSAVRDGKWKLKSKDDFVDLAV